MKLKQLSIASVCTLVPLEAYMTSQPSVTEISVHPKPTDLPINISTPTGMTGMPGYSRFLLFEPHNLCFICLFFLPETFLATPRPSDTKIVCTLVAVIGMFSLCFVSAWL